MTSKSSKSKLQASQQTVKFFEVLLRASSDGILITDSSMDIIEANEAFCAMVGAQCSDIIGTSLITSLKVFDGNARERWTELVKTVYNKCPCRDFEFSKSSDGSVQYFSINASLLEKAADEEKGIIISNWRDVTDQIQAEKTIKESHDELKILVQKRTAKLKSANQQLLREVKERKLAEKALYTEHAQFTTIMDSIDAEIHVTDMETQKIIFANRCIREEFGDIVGKICWQSLQAGQTGVSGFCPNKKLIDDNGQPTSPYVWEIRNSKNGQWYQYRVQAIQWPDGHIVRLSIAVNITDRKQAEIKIQQRDQYLAGLNTAVETLLAQTEMVPFQKFIDKIGPVSGVSRAYIFINHHGPGDELLMSEKAEWCAKGTRPEIDNPLLQGLSYDEWSPRWRNILMQGSIINDRMTDLPDKGHKIFKSHGSLTILIVPIMLDNEFIGFIGFDNHVSGQEWSTVEQTFLQTAARDLAQAIKRARSDERVRASLREKEALLREIHHRVKNNMQVIVSLLRMHSRRTKDPQLLSIFDDSRDRMNAMSLIHEALYQSDDMAKIDFEVYLKKLCRNLCRVYNTSGKRITVTVEQCAVALDMDRGIAVGMVVSELVSNSFKHAFPQGKGGKVSLSLSNCGEGEIELIVKDDGKGLPLEIDIQNSSSLGLKLAVATVKRELGGSIEVERNGGTRYIIRFKDKSY